LCFSHHGHKSGCLNLAESFPVHRIRAVGTDLKYSGRISHPSIPAIRTPLFRFGQGTGKEDEMTAGPGGGKNPVTSPGYLVKG
jgi:hypothetical protein